MGYAYVLEEDAYHGFYDGLLSEGLATGSTILTALICDGAIVAALLGVTNGKSFAMVRLSHAGGDWMKVGPGRLVIERTMHALHARGCRHFDFSLGDYPYKAGFGVAPSPLLDFVAAPSWRGRTSAVRDLAKAAVKRALGLVGVSLVPQAVKNRYRRYHAAN
jgi:CelD/BcsL family acetyltransferase involved in cellulose biosynthesis